MFQLGGLNNRCFYLKEIMREKAGTSFDFVRKKIFGQFK